ncbi:MAG: anaerobic ribonucleoside-triphosphate reductase activating protein [Desulfobacterales bacterium]|nr:anaerobic ribonucleoside-triphosphate reductase activating protein [Desulfobacterales bacterium]
MQLGGIHKNSLIDYPGKISCVLFTAGCNFDCPYCHNPELVRCESSCVAMIEDQQVFDFLETRKSFLDGVVISGGEPTLQKELFDLCRIIKQMGFPVKLDTNGSRPEILAKLIEQSLVDYCAMDIKTDPYEYSPFIRKSQNPDKILDSIRILMESDVPHEFRTTCVKPFVTETVIEKIAKIIAGCRRYTLQAFHESEVLHPDFFAGRNFLYSRKELLKLKALAEPWVQECIIR